MFARKITLIVYICTVVTEVYSLDINILPSYSYIYIYIYLSVVILLWTVECICGLLAMNNKVRLIIFLGSAGRNIYIIGMLGSSLVLS